MLVGDDIFFEGDGWFLANSSLKVQG